MGAPFTTPAFCSFRTASASATKPPVMAAVRVPPSAWITSQSMVMVRGPSAVQVDGGPQGPADEPLDLERAAALLAAGRLAGHALVGGAGQHAVLGGDPAGAGAEHVGRDPVLQAGGAEHVGVAEAGQAGALGVLGDVHFERNGPELAGLPSVGAHGARIITAGGSWRSRRRATARPRGSRLRRRRAPRCRRRRQAAIPAAIAPAIASCRAGRASSFPSTGWETKPELEQHRRHARAGQHVEGSLLHAPVGRPGAAHQRAVDGLGEAGALGQVRLVLEVVEDAAHRVGRVGRLPASRSAFSRAATALAEASVASAERK